MGKEIKKIEPLNIEKCTVIKYMRDLTGEIFEYKEISTEKAIRALFVKMNEVIKSLNKENENISGL